jgi:hypothetical protein
MWGAGAGWALLGGPVGGQAAGVGGCLQGAVGVACGSQLGGLLGGSAGQVFGAAQHAMGQVGVHCAWVEQATSSDVVGQVVLCWWQHCGRWS